MRVENSELKIDSELKTNQDACGERLKPKFFNRDVLLVAPELIGKTLVRKFDDGLEKRYLITETEAYRGEEDLACHASKGRTPRTDVMYLPGGHVYVYLIYGMYWLLNFVTSDQGFPAAVLIRCVEGINGPGKIGRELCLNKSFNTENLNTSDRIWVEDNDIQYRYTTSARVGVAYAGEIWANKPWRFIIEKD